MGFRIARTHHHPRIYATDWMQLAEEDREFVERGFVAVEQLQSDLVAAESDWVKRLQGQGFGGTATEILRNLNRQQFDVEDHQAYLRFRALMGGFPDYVGPFWLR